MKLLLIVLRPVFGLVLLFTLSQAILKAEDSPLDQSMKKMQDAKKELYPAVTAAVPANKDKYVALANVIKTEAEKARDQIPEMASKLPAADKDAMVAAYKKDMDEFIKTAGTLVDALEASDWTKAKSIVDQMKAQEKAGHQAYRPKKER